MPVFSFFRQFFGLFGDACYARFSSVFSKKMPVFVARNVNCSVGAECPASNSSMQWNCGIQLLNCAQKVEKVVVFVTILAEKTRKKSSKLSRKAADFHTKPDIEIAYF